MNKFILRQSILLFLTAVIWGVAFVAQSAGMEYIGPFTYNGVRCILGGLVLIPCVILLAGMQAGREQDRETCKESRRADAPLDGAQGEDVQSGAEPVAARQTQDVGHKGRETKDGWKMLLTGGLCCGVLLFAASNFQQFGIQYTTVGKAGFITAMYILLVPLFGLFAHKKVGWKVWIGVGFAVCGLYKLCMSVDPGRIFADLQEYGAGYVGRNAAAYGLAFGKGDMLVLICACIFSLHILVIDYFSPKVDGVKMSCIQFWICGILSMICAFLLEKPDFSAVLSAWKPVCYGGIMSCGVAYTLQIVGQKDMNPTVASLILSLESVVSVIAGFLILRQSMSMRELQGCCLMVVAIVLAQLPDRRRQHDSGKKQAAQVEKM